MEEVLRVDQLDACELDDSIADILQYHFLEILRPLQSITIDRFKPELKALIRFLLWKFSLSRDSSTFGQRMLNLTYAAKNSESLSSVQKGGLLFYFVFAEWAMDRSDFLLRPLPGAIHSALVRLCSSAVKTFSLINFVIFLMHGCYPTPKERLLRLQMVPTRPQTLRAVSHAYLSREILWHGFSEFLFFILPHFNLFALRNVIRRLWNTGISETYKVCSFCEDSPTFPHISDCGHLYCYYCLSANLKADSSFPCCVCSQAVRTMTPASETIS